MLIDLKELFQRRFLYMKKLFILLVLILAFTNVTSCGGPRPSESDNQVKITATEKTTTTETTKATEFEF